MFFIILYKTALNSYYRVRLYRICSHRIYFLFIFFIRLLMILKTILTLSHTTVASLFICKAFVHSEYSLCTLTEIPLLYKPFTLLSFLKDFLSNTVYSYPVIYDIRQLSHRKRKGVITKKKDSVLYAVLCVCFYSLIMLCA